MVQLDYGESMVRLGGSCHFRVPVSHYRGIVFFRNDTLSCFIGMSRINDAVASKDNSESSESPLLVKINETCVRNSPFSLIGIFPIVNLLGHGGLHQTVESNTSVAEMKMLRENFHVNTSSAETLVRHPE